MHIISCAYIKYHPLIEQDDVSVFFSQIIRLAVTTGY